MCQATAASTKQRCKNRATAGTQYCRQHSETIEAATVVAAHGARGSAPSAIISPPQQQQRRDGMCQAIVKKTGQPCQWAAAMGQEFCYLHC